ncbi:hypothetical protein NE237_010784 [Protea cynaroides]|uniref:Chaperone DnaJ C-terminal domain-containing protein n=1 Tax=Protea cynaroides TaxID=273540 RepID=A0A9Q0L119_9MAGN|nr:hypothetical protein NE237_010784 [Protea cynaroides]
MGDKKPGFLGTDMIFLIAEKRNPIFRREDNDLMLSIELPLVKALIGCTLSIPLLGGEKMGMSLNETVYPGYEKIIPLGAAGETKATVTAIGGDCILLKIKKKRTIPVRLEYSTESPLSDVIICTPLSHSFTLPTLDSYDGMTDLEHHLNSFMAMMLLNGYEDAFIFQGFPNTLRKAAPTWFMNLPAKIDQLL